MDIFLSIVINNIIPIFILVFLGYFLEKKFALDINVLTKIILYAFVPAFAFTNIYSTEISADLLRVILLHVLMLPLMFALGAGVNKLLKQPPGMAKSFENALMFYNSGNIGIPLVTLVFSSAPFIVGGGTPYLELALSVQVMTHLVQNLSLNTIGFINAGGEGMSLKSGLQRVVKMPSPYAILLAFLCNLLPFDVTATPVWSALVFLRSGMIGVALLTLGVQMAKAKIDFKKAMPWAASFCRLVGGPVLAFFLIKLFGMEGIIAQAVFISSSTPTAVTVAVISFECKGDTDFAAQAVALSTLLSAVTMTTVVYLAQILF